MVSWSCLGFPFVLVPTSIFSALSLTAGPPVKTMCTVLAFVSLKELVFWGWWRVSLWTPLCCFVATKHLFSQSFSIVLRCGGLQLNSFSSTRCIQQPGFALIRLSFSCVMMYVASLFIVSLLRELPSTSVRVWHTRAVAAAHPLGLEVSQCRMFQFARCLLPAQTHVWNDLPYTVSDTGALDRFKGVINGWLIWGVCFSVFLRCRCLWGCESNL